MTPARTPTPAAARRRLATFAATSARLAHRGRNRLAVARMALELLRDRAEDGLTDEQRKCFLEELDLFLDDFNLEAQMTRCKPGEVEAVSAREAAAEALDLLRRRAAGIEFILEDASPEKSDRILADPPLLRAVLLSILGGLVEALRIFRPRTASRRGCACAWFPPEPAPASRSRATAPPCCPVISCRAGSDLGSRFAAMAWPPWAARSPARPCATGRAPACS